MFDIHVWIILSTPLDSWWCVVPVDLSETFDLKALSFISFWKDWNNSASWILTLSWLLHESQIPMLPSGIFFICFWTQSFSTSTQKCSWMLFYFCTLNVTLLLCPPSFSKHFFPPSMFYQAALEESTALLTIIVSPERAKPKSFSLHDVLGKLIRFIAQIVLQRSQTPAVLIGAATYHWVRDLCFWSCASICTGLLSCYISWKRVCNQGVCRAKWPIEYFWIQL